MCVKCGELSVVRGMWGERVMVGAGGGEVRRDGIVGWWWWWGSVPDDPSHSQESLETLSAVAAHLCVLFLMAGGGGGGGGGVQTLFGCQVSLPPSEVPCYSFVHMHTHTSDSVEDYSLCYGIWEAPLQLSPSVQTVTPAPLGFYFPFPHPLPSLLSSPVRASR